MSRYSDQIRDEYSRLVPGVSVYVYKWDAYAQVAGDLETLTDDSSAPLGNPLISDDDGLYYFNSTDGQKLLEYHYGGKVQERSLILVGALPVPQATFGGLFINAAALTIPVGMDLITTTGYSTLDKGAAVYTYDIAVNSAYVAANPRSSFIETGGRGFRLSLEQDLTPEMLGAAADGTTDDHDAFAALAPLARGGRITLLKNNYRIDTALSSVTFEEVDLVGPGVLDGATGVIDQGAMLWITGTANSPFKIRRGTSIEGVGFYYPNQVDSASPTAYPATLLFDFTNGPVQFVSIRRNVVYNAYKFIEINDVTGNIGHVEIEGNYICALNRAIYLRYNSEHFRVERNNFTFGHWLAATEAGARAYMRANAIAFQVDQSDGVEFVDNLVFGHLNGVLASALGFCQLMNIADNKFDQVRYPIRATGVGRFDGHINGNTFNAFNAQNTALQGRSISVETTGTGLERVGIGNNNFALATEEHIFTSSDTPSRTLVNAGANRFASWAAFKVAGLYGAINANGANTNVQQTGGHFYGSNSAAFSKGIVGTFNVLEITGAFFDGCVAELDVNCGFVNSTGNRSFNTSGDTSDKVVANDYVNGLNAWAKPSSKMKSVTGATYTVENRYGNFVVNVAGTTTLTLPSAAAYNGPGLRISTVTANTVISASSNVLPVAGGAAGTAILAATAGKWALLVPNGANWQIMEAN